MNQPFSRRIALFAFVCAVSALLPFAVRTSATDIGSPNSVITISTKLIIYDDSELIGDVSCAVPLTMSGANPCIAFGADHIKLRLNGHTIAGPVTPPTSCSLTTDAMYGVGILVNGRTDVKIEGPGIIEHFERWGILLSSSSQVTVRKVTAYHNCWSGLQTASTSDSTLEENLFANDAGGSNGASCGGT
jgi:hypothetical protein